MYTEQMNAMEHHQITLNVLMPIMHVLFALLVIVTRYASLALPAKYPVPIQLVAVH
jgi:hypothetical protein